MEDAVESEVVGGGGVEEDADAGGERPGEEGPRPKVEGAGRKGFAGGRCFTASPSRPFGTGLGVKKKQPRPQQVRCFSLDLRGLSIYDIVGGTGAPPTSLWGWWGSCPTTFQR